MIDNLENRTSSLHNSLGNDDVLMNINIRRQSVQFPFGKQKVKTDSSVSRVSSSDKTMNKTL
jgi:hypothetical protein